MLWFNGVFTFFLIQFHFNSLPCVSKTAEIQCLVLLKLQFIALKCLPSSLQSEKKLTNVKPSYELMFK